MITEKDFMIFVRSDIIPFLQQQEKERMILCRLKKIIPLIVICFFIALGILVKQTNSNGLFKLFFISFFIGFILIGVSLGSPDNFRLRIKHKLLPKIIEKINFNSNTNLSVPSTFSKTELSQFGLPGANFVEDDDFVIYGKKAAIHVKEYILGSLHNLQIYYKLPKPVKGKVFVKNKINPNKQIPRESYLNNFRASPLQQIQLEDISFMKKYDVLGNDQIAARTILTPSTMEKLKAIENVYHLPIDILIMNDKLVLSMNGYHNFFEFIDPNTKLTDDSIFVQFYAEIESIVNLGEILKIS